MKKMNTKVKKIAIAAATTAASTALLATTVAMETAAAATFTYDLKYRSFKETITIEHGDSTTTELSESLREWEKVSVGENKLEYFEEEDGFLSELYELRIFGDNVSVWRKRRIENVNVNWGVHISNFKKLDEDIDPSSEGDAGIQTVPEPSGAIALSILGLGSVASRLRRSSKRSRNKS